jgi:predicted metalloendopeptidase
MLWRIAFQSLFVGSKQMRDLTNDLKRHLYGVTTKRPRWEECLSEMPFLRALSSLYIKKHFDNQTKISVRS